MTVSVLETMLFIWGHRGNTYITYTYLHFISSFLSAGCVFKPPQINTTLKLREKYSLNVQLLQSIVLVARWNLKFSNGSRQPQNFVLILGSNKPQGSNSPLDLPTVFSNTSSAFDLNRWLRKAQETCFMARLTLNRLFLIELTSIPWV